MPIAYVWANGFASGDGIVNRNIAGGVAILGSQQPSNSLSALCTVASCGNCGPGANGCGGTPTSGNSGGTPPTVSSNASCGSPPNGLPNALFCPPNSIPASSYQLSANLNGATKRLDQGSFAGLYGEPSSTPYVQNFYYTSQSGNYTVTQAWLVQRYGVDVRLQIQGDTPVIDVRCINTVQVLFVNQMCSQLIGSALSSAFAAINQYDKASGYVDIDIGYPGIPSQPGEADDFLGAWMAGGSCILSASSTANSPVINGAVVPPGGAAVSVPLCVPHNAVPFAQGSCSATAGQVDFTKYTNASVQGTPLANLCSMVKLRISIASFGPTYKVKVFNPNGGDSQSQTCYQIVSANAIAGTQQGCDWGIAFDQGMILDVPIIFDYMSYFTSRTALKISCGSACGGPGAGNGGGLGQSGPNPSQTGSTLQVTVVNFLGIPITGATVSLTAGSGQATGPNPCTTGTSGFGQCTFNVLAGTWTVTAAENGFSVPILFFNIQIPPSDNVATTQIIVNPGQNQITLQMGLNIQGVFTLVGLIAGLIILAVIVYVGVRAAFGSQGRTAVRTVGAAKTLARETRKR